jgi:predicted transcriptional regulator
MSLSESEEVLMEYLWKLKTAFLRDLIAQYPNPQPASTTIATLLKRMIEKGYVDYNQHGRSREYYPLVSKSTYFARHFKDLKKKFFDNSSSQLASFFASQSDLSESELKELKEIIEKEIQKKEQ